MLHKGGDSHIANDRHERANLLTAEHVSLYPIEEIASRTGAEQIAIITAKEPSPDGIMNMQEKKKNVNL
ncbi:hypothetical protein HMPREF1553_01491 [Porphyromonas gingivalis F0568]|nr:hypothetical protein HMPREF1553_01491 [Porphyromonas gingivalis F0568]